MSARTVRTVGAFTSVEWMRMINFCRGCTHFRWSSWKEFKAQLGELVWGKMALQFEVSDGAAFDAIIAAKPHAPRPDRIIDYIEAAKAILVQPVPHVEPPVIKGWKCGPDARKGDLPEFADDQ